MEESSVLPPLEETQNYHIWINVSGQRFCVYSKSLRKHPNTLLGSNFLSLFYDKERKEYFFDRDPYLFRFIFNFYLLGRLHISEKDCPDAFKDELDFFGIPHSAIDDCCWSIINREELTAASHFNIADVKMNGFGRLGRKEAARTGSSYIGSNDSAKNIGTCKTSENHSMHAKERYEKNSDEMHAIECKRRMLCRRNRAYGEEKRSKKGDCFLYGKQPQQLIFGSYSKQNLENSKKREQRTKIAVHYVISLLVIASAVSTIVETIDCSKGIKCGEMYSNTFFAQETFFVVVFTLEYLFRFIKAPKKYAFLKEVLNIVDVLAILPYYTELVFKSMVGASDVMVMLRVLRVIRLVKLTRFSPKLRTLILTIRSCLKDLLFLYFTFSLGILLFGTALYYSERDSHNAGNFTSIPHSMWYTCVTLMTTGYGDVVPVTVSGKILGALCGLCGVVIMSLPIPIMQDKRISIVRRH